MGVRQHLNSTAKIFCIGITIFFLLGLIPLVLVAFYDRPQVDDFYYGVKTYHAFAQTGSWWETIRAAVEQCLETYQNWQGSFVAVFLFALQPGIFGEQWYPITFFLLMGCLLASTLFFSRILLRKKLQLSRTAWWIASMILLFLSIQFLPSPVQGYYWWNGGIYYTFFYSLSLFLFGLLLNFEDRSTLPGKLIQAVGIGVLGFLLGGGNYVTALLSFVLLFLGTLWKFMQKKVSGWIWLWAFLWVGLSFGISILSPGNEVRALSYSDTPGIGESILQSLYFGASELFHFSTLPVFVCLLPLLLMGAKAGKQSSFSYPKPLLFTGFSFLVYCAQFAPTVYAMGSMGEKRIQNLYFFTFLWWWACNLLYWGGWLSKQGVALDKVEQFFRNKKNLICLGLVFTVVFCLPATEPQVNFRDYECPGFAAVDASYSLFRHQPQTYGAEYDQRVKWLKDPSMKKVEFQPFTVTPDLLFYGDLTRDPHYMWSNQPVAEYYQKDSVVVLWPYE